MRTRGRPGISFVALASLLLAACSGKNEVVAEELPAKDDASTLLYVPSTDATKCAPGHYEGTFVSHSQTAGSGGASGGGGIPVSGTFSFLLQPKLMGGEFLRLAASAFHGTTSTFTFDATITGSADCSSGEFSSKMEDGKLSLPGGGPASTFGFHGTVTGFYDEPPNPHYPPVFSGDWTVYQTRPDAGVVVAAPAEPVLAGGTWSAFFVSPP